MDEAWRGAVLVFVSRFLRLNRLPILLSTYILICRQITKTRDDRFKRYACCIVPWFSGGFEMISKSLEILFHAYEQAADNKSADIQREVKA